ncbi:MAG TPA: hypothetical protein VE863_03350, partial [Pyrinomonadaceae bacterium]|nr:hypothetical protein [Pyrinomonadaceae bacterium]
FLHVADSHFWAIVTLIAIVIWKPQIAKLIPRIQKAELPGGPKFEIEKIDELQKSINPWKKTVSRFAELMEWVGDLILDTPPEDVVTLLAYTPALGYLTRTEAEWRPLHRLIVERPNVRLICLKQEELAEWHGRFAGKKTARPEGTISATLIDKANRISADLVADKKRQIDPRQTFVFEKGLEELPGYYLFANSKRAIIAVPLFLPSDPKKFAPETDADGYLGNTPVKMLGFESSDNWTVWLVKEVCDHYANLKRKDTQVLDLSKMEDTRPSDTSAIAPDGDFRSQRVLSLPRYYDSVRRTAVTSGLSRNEIESYSLFLVVCLWEC